MLLKRMIHFIFLILSVLAGTMVFAPGANAENCKYEQPIEIIKKEGGENIVQRPPPKEEIPSSTLTITILSNYQDRWSWEPREEDIGWLFVFALDRCSKLVRENIHFARANGWPRKLISDLEEILVWAEAIRDTPGQEIYKLSKTYTEDEKNYSNKHVSRRLLVMAVDKEHPPAMFDYAQKMFDEGFPILGMRYLSKSGDRGYKLALSDLISRHMDGRGFTRSNAVAYYWLIRSREFGFTELKRTAELIARLTDFDQKRAKHWIVRGEYPKRWEYRKG